MTSSIDNELAALIGAERDRPAAGAEAADRVWSGVQARLEGAPPPASVPATSGWGPLSLVVGAGIVAALVGGGWALSQPRQGDERFEPIPPPPSVVVESPAVVSLRAELPGEPAEPEAPVAGAEPKPVAVAAKVNQGSVADELALIERARTALDSGRAGAALGVLRTHRKQFPKGAFVEEASALRASALCKSGREDAAEKAAAKFLRRYPKSVHAGRVSACRDEAG